MNISTSLLSKFTKKEIDMLFKAVRVMGKIPAALLLGAPATQEYGRLLLVVSKKTGNAPQRNKLRRRLKDIFYKELPKGRIAAMESAGLIGVSA